MLHGNNKIILREGMLVAHVGEFKVIILGNLTARVHFTNSFPFGGEGELGSKSSIKWEIVIFESKFFLA